MTKTQLDLTGEPTDPDDDRQQCPKGCGELVYPRRLPHHLDQECSAVDRDVFDDGQEVPAR